MNEPSNLLDDCFIRRTASDRRTTTLNQPYGWCQSERPKPSLQLSVVTRASQAELKKKPTCLDFTWRHPDPYWFRSNFGPQANPEEYHIPSPGYLA
ncbi:Protein of unknown function [Pyronema omphalodes CBS 100304]|uniref:Uncharacterized protein n=1 Tax=Pyronema omphalodes (strain CBS 100304) TaxID=1076935 RepID=U4LVT5_PYROM|nr:Protein of unknown function [Pyronema omphalodes CBS 100304]